MEDIPFSIFRHCVAQVQASIATLSKKSQMREIGKNDMNQTSFAHLIWKTRKCLAGVVKRKIYENEINTGQEAYVKILLSSASTLKAVGEHTKNVLAILTSRMSCDIAQLSYMPHYIFC
jgi:hypothetical protein